MGGSRGKMVDAAGSLCSARQGSVTALSQLLANTTATPIIYSPRIVANQLGGTAAPLLGQPAGPTAVAGIWIAGHRIGARIRQNACELTCWKLL